MAKKFKVGDYVLELKSHYVPTQRYGEVTYVNSSDTTGQWMSVKLDNGQPDSCGHSDYYVLVSSNRVKNRSIRRAIIEDTHLYRGVRRAQFASIVRGLMLKDHLCAADIAKRTGVSEQKVSNWLKGTQNLRLDTMYLIADALGKKLVVDVV